MLCNSHPSLRSWVLRAFPAEQTSSSHITEMANRGLESLGNCSGSHSKSEAGPGEACPPFPGKPPYLTSPVFLALLRGVLSARPCRRKCCAASKMATSEPASWLPPLCNPLPHCVTTELRLHEGMRLRG